MSVLEICQLRIKEGIPTDDPTVLKSLIEVRSALKSKITNTKSKFYQCVKDPTLVFIFGVWPNIAAHETFLSSPLKPEILSPQQDILDFGWILHIPLPGMECLPLGAPVTCLARFLVKSGNDHVQLRKVLEEARPRIVDATKPYQVVDEWRCDPEPESEEAVLIMGWPSVKAQEDCTAEAILLVPEYGRFGDLSHGVEIKALCDMEA